MPRYFFNVRDGRAILDDVGSDLADDDAARAEAVCTSAQLLLGLEPAALWHGEDWTLEVTTADGRTVGTLRFSGTTVRH